MIHALTECFPEWSGWKLLELLLEAGASINDKGKKGYTSLMGASRRGHEEIVKMLLQKGASINDKNQKEVTALICASRRGHEELVKMLLQKGASINDKDKWRDTRL